MRLFHTILLLMISISLYALPPQIQKEIDEKYKDFEVKGPDILRQFTDECNMDNLRQIEASLKGDEYKIVEYDYKLSVVIKDQQIKDLVFADFPFDDAVKGCIHDKFLAKIKYRPEDLKEDKTTPPYYIAEYIVVTAKKAIEMRESESYVHGSGEGEKHCYYFRAPKGWHLDNTYNGIPLLMYPEDGSYDKSKSYIYTKVAVKKIVGKTVDDFIKYDTKFMEKKYNIKVAVTELAKLYTDSKYLARVFKFEYNDGVTEFIAYFNNKKNDTINYFLLKTTTPENQSMYDDLIHIINTYREADDCVPCCDKEKVIEK